jgi:hypothetical protein
MQRPWMHETVHWACSQVDPVQPLGHEHELSPMHTPPLRHSDAHAPVQCIQQSDKRSGAKKKLCGVLWSQLVPVHPLWHMHRASTQFPFTQFSSQELLRSIHIIESTLPIDHDSKTRKFLVAYNYHARILIPLCHQDRHTGQVHSSSHH